MSITYTNASLPVSSYFFPQSSSRKHTSFQRQGKTPLLKRLIQMGLRLCEAYKALQSWWEWITHEKTKNTSAPDTSWRKLTSSQYYLHSLHNTKLRHIVMKTTSIGLFVGSFQHTGRAQELGIHVIRRRRPTQNWIKLNENIKPNTWRIISARVTTRYPSIYQAIPIHT